MLSLKNNYLLVLLLSISIELFGQVSPDPIQQNIPNAIALDSIKTFTPTAQDYKFWHSEEVRQIIDTTHTIANYYNQNFIKKDIFGLMPFPNTGQPFNRLVYTEGYSNQIQLLPTGKSYSYINPEEIRYFDVKTPTTELTYENAVREGQAFTGLFTHSPSQRFNYAIQYNGLRSLGRYLESLSAANAFIVSTNYHTKSNKYNLWGHYTNQIINNKENDGITNIDYFETNNSNYRIRDRMPVNLAGAISHFDSRRVFLGQSLGLIKGNALDYSLKIKNIFSHETQNFNYKESADNNHFPSTYVGGVRADVGEKSFSTLQDRMTLAYTKTEKINIEAGVKLEKIKLSVNDSYSDSKVTVPKNLAAELFSVVGSINAKPSEKLNLTSNAEYTTGNLFQKQYLWNTKLITKALKNWEFQTDVFIQAKIPSLNLWLNRSIYTDYNYYNPDFKTIDTKKISISIISEQFKTKITGNVFDIKNLTYIDVDYNPNQLNSNINLYQIKVENELKHKRFNLNTTLLFQRVNENKQYLPLPTFVVRATLYYQNYAFKKAAELQMGLNVYYFNKFSSMTYFPVLNEFMLENNSQQIGNFPLVDLFFNAKVKRMRFYIRAEHINALFGGYNYYSAPSVPYRDFKFQIGLKWYLFT